jgi:hypothetical protein
MAVSRIAQSDDLHPARQHGPIAGYLCLPSGLQAGPAPMPIRQARQPKKIPQVLRKIFNISQT